jgi:hypothetical protein
MAPSGLNVIAARLSPGAISVSSSSHLPASGASKVAKPVTFPSGGQAAGRCAGNQAITCALELHPKRNGFHGKRPTALQAPRTD